MQKGIASSIRFDDHACIARQDGAEPEYYTVVKREHGYFNDKPPYLEQHKPYFGHDPYSIFDGDIIDGELGGTIHERSVE